MFLQAVREIRPDFNMLVRGFKQNYLGIVLANLLTVALVLLGCIMLLIPGIIIACRLAFVGFLVMDKGLDPISAVEESWRMTRGYGWTIFGMAYFILFYIHCRPYPVNRWYIACSCMDWKFLCHIIQ